MLVWMIRGNVKSKGCELGVRWGAGLSPCHIPHPAALCYDPPPTPTEGCLLGPCPSAAPPVTPSLCHSPQDPQDSLCPPPQSSLLTLAHCSPGHGGEEGPEGLRLGMQQEFRWSVKHEHWGVSVQGLGTDGGAGRDPKFWGGEEEEQDGAVPLLPLEEGINGGEGQIAPPPKEAAMSCTGGLHPAEPEKHRQD